MIDARVSVLGQEFLNHGGALLRRSSLKLLQLLLDGIWSCPHAHGRPHTFWVKTVGSGQSRNCKRIALILWQWANLIRPALHSNR